MAAVTIKRKRGRPRRDEPTEINDFDVALIREFAQRPAFYDRSCVHYRNRDYIELQWEEMAKNLGYNIPIIRERMIQLRNRFNLEKRRVETMQDQYNDPDIKSQWPMYEYMTFLGDHIKARRPYTNSKSAVLSNSVRTKHTSNNSNSSSNDEDEYEESQIYTSNDSDTEQQNSNKMNYNSNHIQNIKKSTSAHLQNESNSNSRLYLPAPIPTDQLNTTTPAVSQQQQQNQIKFNPQMQQRHRENSTQQQRQQNYQMQHQQQQQSNYHHHHQRSHQYTAVVDKFKAFGQFLAASLIDMNEVDALRLVDKFTSELVRHACIHAEMKSNTHQESDNETDQNISV